MVSLLLLKAKPEWVFLTVGLIFGLAALLITPPLQGHDEDVHFISIWNFSEGNLSNYYAESMERFVATQRFLFNHHDRKYSRELWQQSFQYRESPDDASPKYGCELSIAGLPSYAVQIAALRVARLFTDRYLIELCFARLANLGSCLLLGWLALRTVPCCKWLFAMLAMTPMSLILGSVLSYDGLTNVLVLLFIAELLKALRQPVIAFARNWRLLLSALLLNIAKIPYMFVAGILWLLPAKRFKKSILWQWGIPFLILGICVVRVLHIDATHYIPRDGDLVYIRFFAPDANGKDPAVIKIFHDPHRAPQPAASKPTAEQPAPYRESLTQRNDTSYVTLMQRALKNLQHFEQADEIRIATYLVSWSGSFFVFFERDASPVLLGTLVLYCLMLGGILFGFSPNPLAPRLRWAFGGMGILMFAGVWAIFYTVGDIARIQGRYFIPCAMLLIPAVSCGGFRRRVRHWRVFRNGLCVGAEVLLAAASLIDLWLRYY